MKVQKRCKRDGREERKWVDRVVYIILLYCKKKKKNWDVKCIVRWVDKIDKVVFEDVK